MIKRIYSCLLILICQNVFSQNITENDSIKYPTTIAILEKYKITDFETFDYTINSQIKLSEINQKIKQLESASDELVIILKNITEKEKRLPYVILKGKIYNKVTLAKSKLSLEDSKIAAEKAKIEAEKSKREAEKSKREAKISTEIVKSLKKGENQIKKD